MLGVAGKVLGLLAGASLSAVLSIGAASATELTLINGWTNTPYHTARADVRIVDGVVRFSGAISGGNNAEAFVLPEQLRPAGNVYIPVDMCNATNGRLIITPAGGTSVEAESSFANAQCFTSLEGAYFTRGNSRLLHLKNGWTNAPFGTRSAAARYLAFTPSVNFEGAVATTGTNAEIFVLPESLRPSSTVYVPADLCNASNGRLQIEPSGAVYVEPETEFGDAQCFTSLDGVSLSANTGAYASLKLLNGWTQSSYGGAPGVTETDSVVFLKGAIATGGTNPEPFRLPYGFRPPRMVYVKVDMCNATNGRLIITPGGTVTVQAETSFSNAQCFTSLDGVTFRAAPLG